MLHYLGFEDVQDAAQYSVPLNPGSLFRDFGNSQPGSLKSFFHQMLVWVVRSGLLEDRAIVDGAILRADMNGDDVLHFHLWVMGMLFRMPEDAA